MNKYLLKLINSHQRQKLLNPISLRSVQVILDLFRSYPVIRKGQEREITPFFIIGSGRSGTTLLRSALMRHSKLNIPPETMGRIPNTVKKYYRYGGLDWEDLVHVIVGEFSSFDTFDLWEIDMLTIRRKLYTLERSERSLARILDVIYQSHMAKHKPQAEYWGDKSPFNTLRLKWILRVFPNAKYINIIRDGRDVVSSYLKAGLLPTAEKACERWIRSVEAYEKLDKRRHAKVTSIYYEEFVKDPSHYLNKLCEFLEIEFEAEMLEEQDVRLGDEHLDHMQNVTGPITDESIGKWKYNLSEEQQNLVHRRLESKLTKYGYLN